MEYHLRTHSVARAALTLVFALALAAQPLATAAPGDELVDSGKGKYQSADYDGAIQTLTQFVTQYPQNQQRNVAELYLGCSYLMRKNGEDRADNNIARQHFQFIINQGKAESYYREASFHNARSYYCEKDYASAIPLLRQFLADYPNDDFDKYAYYYLGVSESQVGSLQTAVADLDAALAIITQQDSVLRWYCLLEKAMIAGKLGQYASADQQLAQIYSGGAPVDIVGQAAIQRALIMLTQQRNDEAISLLNDYINRYGADPASAITVQEAYVYQAYCYFAKRDANSALQVVQRLESVAQSLPPEAATLKIKLLLNLGRIQEAETLLNQLAQSSYGQTLPDLITLYRAMVALAKSDRDSVISSLTNMLGPKVVSNSPPRLEFNYFKTQRNYLAPLDFTEACGILTLAYAGRYANNPNRVATPTNDPDYNGQELVYQATADYVRSQNDPAINMVLNAVDQGRKKIISNPNAAKQVQEGLSVLAPGYNAQNGNAMGAGGFANPTDPQNFQNPGLTNVSPNYSGYAPAGQQGQTAQQNPQQGITYPNLPANANQQAQQANPNAPNAQNNQTVPNAYAQQNAQPAQGNQPTAQANQNQAANYPAGNQPTAAQNAQTPTNNVVNNSANPNGYVDPNATANQQQQQQQQAPTPANEVAAPLTPQEAREALKKATAYFQNLEFDRANDVLLQATTKSETFWTDCPAEAARIAILRANVLFELNKRSEAAMTCQDLIDREPNSPEAALANFYLGSLADSVGRAEDAVDYLRAATRGRADFPYTDVALYYLGTNELERGDVTAAAQTFEKLYKNYPDSAYWSHGAWRLAKIESDRRNDVPAERIVNDALAHKPDAAIIDYLLFLKGEIALRAKDYDKALVAFDMIVDQYPESVWYSRAKNRIAAIPEAYKGAQVFPQEDEQVFLEDDLDYSKEDDFIPIPPANAPNPTRVEPNILDRQYARPGQNSAPVRNGGGAQTNPAPSSTNPAPSSTNPAPNSSRTQSREPEPTTRNTVGVPASDARATNPPTRSNARPSATPTATAPRGAR